MLTLRQVERHLDGAAEILRFSVSPAEMRNCLIGMLLLKHCSDEYDTLRERPAAAPPAPPAFSVPPGASWRHLERARRDAGTAALLDEALRALEAANPALAGVSREFRFTRAAGRSAAWDAVLGRLIAHFSRVRLAGADFEFPDLPGAAYEYLLAELAGPGRVLGEYYTPRGVAAMMTRLIAPQPGMSVYDPCCGSGGLLACALEYAGDGGGTLTVHGQELNPATLAIAKVNMTLRGAAADLRGGDTLADPAHLSPGGGLARFDRVLANPPFSAGYRREDLRHRERFAFGWPPETGKKADLMYAQHVLAVLEPDGAGAVVMPHGVLFRGGKEKGIRREIIAADRLEAVIGLPPNLFQGTAIPACVLILRGAAPRPPSRQGRVLFVNAERQYTAGRGQNRMDDSHIAKVELAYREFRDVPGLARVVTAAELEDGGWNLNIRRYCDPSPPQEPQDVRAHLHGGVPDGEIAAFRDRFAAYGIDVSTLFSPAARMPGYRDFPDGGWQAAADRIPVMAARRKAELGEAFSAWWARCARQVTDLAESGRLAETRRELAGSFTAALEPLGMTGRHELAGVIAGWLGETRYDFQVLARHGFAGLTASWLAAALEPGPGRPAGGNGRGSRLASFLPPDLLGELGNARDHRDDLAGQAAAAALPPEDPEDGEDGGPLGAPARLRDLRSALAAARQAVRELERELPCRLQARASALNAAGQEAMILSALRAGLEERLDAEFAAGTRELSERYRTWAGKYAVSQHDLDRQCHEAGARVKAHLEALGYGDPPPGRQEPRPGRTRRSPAAQPPSAEMAP